jgi:cytidylate kinase
MANFEIHTVKANGEDLGIMVFENGELAVYSTAKIAQRVADGMNKISNIRHEYVVVQREA